MDDQRSYYVRLAAAYVRGYRAEEVLPIDPRLLNTTLDELSTDEQRQLLQIGLAAQIRLHRFNQTTLLPRVAAVLGILRGFVPTNLLDIGSGRGAFLWPLLDQWPTLPITTIDLLAHRVAAMQAVADGGITNLTPLHGDATNMPFADSDFDLVCALEVLEHIPATDLALREMLRVAQRALILSVPAHPDDNPEHIHLFTSARLEHALMVAGAASVRFQYVPGHIIAIAKKSHGTTT
jgi:SAM-dependent methyltransferase